MTLLNDPHLAVLPIVFSGGAAILPAIIAGATTFLSLLFRPRELMRAIRRRPLVAASVLASFSLLIFVVMWIGSGSPDERAGADSGTAIDWAARAREMIRNERSGTPSAALPAAPAHASAARPFIFREGPDRLGYDGGAVPSGLSLRWSYYPRWVAENGAEEIEKEAMILSSPAAANGLVFCASVTLDPPNTCGSIFCVDAATGRQRWVFDSLGGEDLVGFFSSPAVSADGASLVIGQGLHPDENCRLICLDTGTGRLRWSRPVELHIEGSPCIDGDIVVAGAGAIESPDTHLPTSHSGFVFAVRLGDGKELWRYDVADPESSPAMADGIVYVGSGYNGCAIVALRTQTDARLEREGVEREMWRRASAYPVTGAVTLIGELVIVGTGNGDYVYRDPNPAGVVLALDSADGSVSWKVDTPDAVLGAVAARDDLLICPVANGDVLALRPADGATMWRTRVGRNAGVLAGPALASDSVFVVSQNGYLVRLDASSGDVLEKHYVNDVARPGPQGLSISSPLVAGGALFVGSETGGLRCYTGTGNR